VHLQPAYQDRLPLRLPLPNTEKVAAQVLSLPLYPELSIESVKRVAQTILEWVQ
jgi:dTDP-4-amino-4,6-dideoxygalactose transaminase